MVDVPGSRDDDPAAALVPGGGPAERRFGPFERRSSQGGRRKHAELNHATARAWKVQDVAEFLQASESWVRNAAAGGRLPCVKIGGLLRFDPDEIRSLARSQAPARALPRRTRE
jgi:hypothetical protein